MRNFVRNWMEAYGFKPDDQKNVKLFSDLVKEELNELVEAYAELQDADPDDELDGQKKSWHAQKEAADLLWVVHGLILSMGIDVEPMKARLFMSNMSKWGTREEIEEWIKTEQLDAHAEPLPYSERWIAVRNSDGKRLKGPNYRTVEQI